MPLTKLRPTFTLTEDRLRELQAILPEAFADGRINWDTLREALGERLEDETQEHFGLFWPGKREARRLAALPSKGTLVPQPGEGVDEDNTHNLFIEGDNLEVLKLLQKSYAGRVGIIYIDPPYNTGNDFVYEDDFVEPLLSYLQRTGQVSEEGMVLTTNSKSNGRFHSKWLSMIYPRLLLAKSLLQEDGVIFVSIGEDELHNLKHIICEVFGEENYAGTIVWQRSKKGDAKLIAQTHEYILVAVKNKEKAIESGVWRKPKDGASEVLAYYEVLVKENKNDHEKIGAEIRRWFNSLNSEDTRKNHQHYCWSDDRGLYFADNFAGPDDGRKSRPRYDIIHPITKKPCKKPSTGWRWEESRTKAALEVDPPLIHFGKDETTIPCRKVYLKDVSSEPFASVFYRDGRSATLQVESLVGKGVMDFPKNTDVLLEIFQIIPDKYSLVLDFFAGSCSTGHAIWELNKLDNGNRKFILVQLPERTGDDSRARNQGFKTIFEIGKERLKKASSQFKAKNNKQLDFSSKIQDSGFKIYKLETSNYSVWDNYSGKSASQLELKFEEAETPLVKDWKPENLFSEILLLQGFPLDSRVNPLNEVKTNSVQKIASEFVAHPLYICLDKKIKPETVEKLKLDSEDIFVCLDSALSDESKIALADRCNLQII